MKTGCRHARISETRSSVYIMALSADEVRTQRCPKSLTLRAHGKGKEEDQLDRDRGDAAGGRFCGILPRFYFRTPDTACGWYRKHLGYGWEWRCHPGHHFRETGRAQLFIRHRP